MFTSNQRVLAIHPVQPRRFDAQSRHIYLRWFHILSCRDQRLISRTTGAVPAFQKPLPTLPGEASPFQKRRAKPYFQTSSLVRTLVDCGLTADTANFHEKWTMLGAQPLAIGWSHASVELLLNKNMMQPGFMHGHINFSPTGVCFWVATGPYLKQEGKVSKLLYHLSLLAPLQALIHLWTIWKWSSINWDLFVATKQTAKLDSDAQSYSRTIQKPLWPRE